MADPWVQRCFSSLRLHPVLYRLVYWLDPAPGCLESQLATVTYMMQEPQSAGTLPRLTSLLSCPAGTFITEWKEGGQRCEAFLAGDDRSYQAVADQLVLMAQFLRFDGWLINIENSLSVSTAFLVVLVQPSPCCHGASLHCVLVLGPLSPTPRLAPSYSSRSRFLLPSESQLPVGVTWRRTLPQCCVQEPGVAELCFSVSFKATPVSSSVSAWLGLHMGLPLVIPSFFMAFNLFLTAVSVSFLLQKEKSDLWPDPPSVTVGLRGFQDRGFSVA